MKYTFNAWSIQYKEHRNDYYSQLINTDCDLPDTSYNKSIVTFQTRCDARSCKRVHINNKFGMRQTKVVKVRVTIEVDSEDK